MKLKMTEHYQDSSQVLILGDEVEVNDSLGQWLIDNGKAVKIEKPVEKPAEVKHEVRESKLDDKRKR